MKAGKGKWPKGLKIIMGLLVMAVGLILMLEYLGGEQKLETMEQEISVPPIPASSAVSGR